MATSVKVNFYKIGRCGYFSESGDWAFCNLRELIDDVESWAFDGTKPLGNTCTYQPDPDDPILETYFFNLARKENDVLLATWNRTAATSGRVKSVSGSRPAGIAEVTSTPTPSGNIPGYPTYFWFLLDKNVFATIRFGSTENGHVRLRLLLKEFLGVASRYCNQTSNSSDTSAAAVNEGLEISGYSPDEEENYTYDFHSYPARKKAGYEILRTRREEIRKVIRKSVLLQTMHTDVGFLGKIGEAFGLTNPSFESQKLRLRAELNFTPTEAQLEEMITTYEGEGGTSKFSDVGFMFSNEVQVHWLSKDLVRTTVELDIILDDNGVVDALALVNALNSARGDLFSIVGG